MKKLTLVSFYYVPKPQQLEKLIKACWQRIESSRLARVFVAYDLEQVHGTIIGLEKKMGLDEFIHVNALPARKEEMNFDKFFALLDRQFSEKNIKIRLGGFDKFYNDFTSLGKLPYERSFQVQWATGKCTIVGWPFQGKQDFTSSTILWDLRNKMDRECNIKHKYPNDNDFFMVIGEIKNYQLLSEQELVDFKLESAIIEEYCREYIALNPIELEINYDNLVICQYEQETLPLDSTNVFKLKKGGIVRDFMEKLYQ